MKFNRVGLYVRVSTDIQVDGYSIDEQLERLEKYCDSQDWTIYEKYIDPGYSGSNINRPGMTKMIKDVREKKLDLVLVYKLDRLSRSQKDTLYLIESEFLPNKVEFISMTESFDTSTPFGRAMIGILAVFAQLERENIRERLGMGRLGRAKAGLWHAGANPPTGYDLKDGNLVINEYEALQIRLIFTKFLAGESFISIARYMNENYTNRYSSYAQANTISTIISNNLYIGVLKYKGQEYKGAHDPIIDEETFNRAQARYKEISGKWGEHFRAPYKRKNLLTGLVYCGNCGARYFVYTCRSYKAGEKQGIKKPDAYRYYKCYSRDGNSKMGKMKGCKNPNYRVEILDRVVLDEIKKLKSSPEYLDQIVAAGDPAVPEEDHEIRILKTKLQETEEKINRFMDLYAIGSIPKSDIGDRVKDLYTERTKIEDRIAALEREKPKAPEKMTRGEVLGILDTFDDQIDETDLATKRKLVEALIDRIEILPEPNAIKIVWKFA